jgi:hypothetical protein
MDLDVLRCQWYTITGLEHLLNGEEALPVVWSSMLLRCARGAIVMLSSTS